MAATAAASLAKPFVHGAFAAGKLSVGFWDHWVPGANNTLTKLCNEWAEKKKVEITIDYITSQGDKLLLTGAAEAQARSGHDMLTFLAWAGAAQADELAPLDDMMAELIKAERRGAGGHDHRRQAERALDRRAGARSAARHCRPAPASTISSNTSGSI